jgi:uncharacterized protein (TIGR02231 family)
LLSVFVVLGVMANGPTPHAIAAVPSQITAVTVDPAGAMVTRSATVAINAGDGVVAFEGFPDSLVANSLRVSASATNNLAIASVEAKFQYQKQAGHETVQRLEQELTAQQDAKREIGDRIKAMKDQLAFIRSLARLAPENVKEGMLTGDPEHWAGAWERIGQGTANAYQHIQQQEISLRDVEAEIKRLQQELGQIRNNHRQTFMVKVHYHADVAGEAAFSLVYRVQNVSWKPRYDARLDTDNTRLELVQLAEVQQASGVDWNGISLTLSTARPSSDTAMPEPTTWWIDEAQPTPSRVDRRGAISAPKSRGFSLGQLDFYAAEQVSEARHIGAEQIISEFAASYRVPGRVSIPADGARHRFTVNTLDEAVTLAVLSHPKADAHGFLYAKWHYTGKSPLLPGHVTLFRDGNLVGHSRLKSIRPDETTRIPFGVDNQVQIRYQVDADTTGGSGVFGTKKKVQRRYLVSVENHHAQEIPVTLYDRLPVSRHDKIKVKLLEKYGTPPTTTDDDNRKGVISWQQTMPKKSKWQVRFGYQITHPTDMKTTNF